MLNDAEEAALREEINRIQQDPSLPDAEKALAVDEKVAVLAEDMLLKKVAPTDGLEE